MGNDDELGFPAHLAQIAGKAHHVGVVQGGLDLVHDAEGSRPHLQNGKVQGDSHKGPLSAGQQGKGLQGLTGWLHLDLDATAQHVLRVLQAQLRLSPPEQFLEGLLEVLVDQGELGLEDPGHLPSDLGDDVLQLPLRLGHIIPLAGKIGVPLIDPFKLFHCVRVDVPQGRNRPF